MTNAARIDRGRRAKLAFDEFVKPATDAALDIYTERMRQIVAKEPWEVEKIKALVMAQRIVDTVAAELENIMADGSMAKGAADRAEQIASMPAARRRALGL